MPVPASGGTYPSLLQPNINPLNVRKAIVTDILIRDYLKADGTVNQLSDPSQGLDATSGFFTPFAIDGKLRQDLLITSAITPNLGFYHLGGLHEDGNKMRYQTTVAETMIAQSKRAARFDITADNDFIVIKALEATPLVDALRYDLPLKNLADLGQTAYMIAKPAETLLLERQVIALGFDGDNYFAQTYPRMALKNRGDANWNKKEADHLELELGALLCPYVAKPVLYHREGATWRGLQGAPVFPSAPTAVAAAGAQANITFAKPTSKSSSFTYVVQKSNDGATGWTTATPVSTSGTSTITILCSGVTASQTWFFRVQATGSNGITTTSVNSNSIVGLT